jgi:hypothetical protein
VGGGRGGVASAQRDDGQGARDLGVGLYPVGAREEVCGGAQVFGRAGVEAYLREVGERVRLLRVRAQGRLELRGGLARPPEPQEDHAVVVARGGGGGRQPRGLREVARGPPEVARAVREETQIPVRVGIPRVQGQRLVEGGARAVQVPAVERRDALVHGRRRSRRGRARPLPRRLRATLERPRRRGGERRQQQRGALNFR